MPTSAQHTWMTANNLILKTWITIYLLPPNPQTHLKLQPCQPAHSPVASSHHKVYWRNDRDETAKPQSFLNLQAAYYRS